MEQDKKVSRNNIIEQNNDAKKVIKTIINFLQFFIPITLAKRLVGIVLIAAEIPSSRVTELTGLSERSVRSLKKAVREEEIESLLKIKRGGGRKSKTADVEKEILAELEKNNYHTHQQIADMIEEKFQIKISPSAVGRLLKKTASKG